MTDLVELIDYDAAVSKIIAGAGTAALSFPEWRAFNRQEMGQQAGDMIIAQEAAADGMTLRKLLDAGDRASIHVEAVVWSDDVVEIKTCRYEIAEPV